MAGRSAASTRTPGPWKPGKPPRGNTWHLVHGADSPPVVEAVARIRHDEVVAQAPWLEQPIFADALHRYARAEARARLLSAHIFRVADEQGAEKVPQRLWEAAVASDNAASKAAAELGVTPLARARLAALTTSAEATAAGLADLAATGKAIKERRLAELAAQTDEPEEETDA